MVNNKLAIITAAAAMAQQVSGLSAHRHMHSALEKRALDAEARVAELEARGVVYETVWEYVTKTVHFSPGQDAAAPTDNADPVVVVEQAPPAAEPVPTTFVQAPAPVAEAPAPAPEAPKEEAPKKEAPKKEAPKKEPSRKEKQPSTGSGEHPFDGKRGIAYNDAHLANVFGGNCESCCWGYNWASRRDDLDSKYDFVPMLWGTGAEWTSKWEKDATDMIEQGAKALFSFNEPDIAEQANLTPGQAAQAYQQYMNPFAGKALLGAPAISNSGHANQGLDWLQKFIDACDGNCKFDFVNIHWYSEPEYADTLFEQIKKANEISGKPVWLTEFAPLGSGPAVDNFVKEVIPKLDEIDYLDAYSYFFVAQDHLMSGQGLSSSGKLYASVA